LIVARKQHTKFSLSSQLRIAIILFSRECALQNAIYIGCRVEPQEEDGAVDRERALDRSNNALQVPFLLTTGERHHFFSATNKLKVCALKCPSYRA
jgi:hypothetical protein